jgi:hypothetical protein
MSRESRARDLSPGAVETRVTPLYPAAVEESKPRRSFCRRGVRTKKILGGELKTDWLETRRGARDEWKIATVTEIQRQHQNW